jgi:hypothetical protein
MVNSFIASLIVSRVAMIYLTACNCQDVNTSDVNGVNSIGEKTGRRKGDFVTKQGNREGRGI